MEEVTIRRARPGDSSEMAEVWIRSYAAALPTVRRAHTDDEVREWFASVVVPQHEAWVAVDRRRVVGLLVLVEAEIEQLYLAPEWGGNGIGDRFIELAKQRRPGGLSLWTFQVNKPAQRFYERHAFVPTERTNGSANEEHEPDIRYKWDPRSNDRVEILC
jgi:GNAT superfamily N-acetyltransferase